MFTLTNPIRKCAKQKGLANPDILAYGTIGMLVAGTAFVALMGGAAWRMLHVEASSPEQQRVVQERKLELETLMTRLPPHERIQDFTCSPMLEKHSLACTYTVFSWTLEKHRFTTSIPFGESLEKISYSAENHNKGLLNFSPELSHEKRMALLQSLRPEQVE